MKKRHVRCYERYFQWDGVPEKVYYLVEDGWKQSLNICIKCGELFFIDWENPKTLGLTIQQIANEKVCPSCADSLASSLKSYPDTFITKKGELSHFESPPEKPSGDNSVVIEFWEIKPD